MFESVNDKGTDDLFELNEANVAFTEPRHLYPEARPSLSRSLASKLSERLQSDSRDFLQG